MARRPFSHQDSQIDPFNAGEPIMPWDDPDAAHVECGLDDLDSAAGYDAPSPDRSARQQAREQKRKQEETRKAAKRRAPSAEAANAGIEAGGGANAATQATRPWYAPQDDEAGGTARRDGAAGQGPSGRASKKRGRGCLLIILALVALELLSSLISCAGDAVDSIFGADDSALDETLTALSEDDDSYDASASAYDDLTDEELRCVELVEERLSGLIDDEEARQLVIGELAACLDDYTGRTFEELGIDADAFADWYLGVFWYEIDSAYCWDDGTGTVYFYYMEADYTTTFDFAESVAAYLEEQGVEAGDALTAEQLESMQALYEGYLDDLDTEADGFEYVDVVETGGTWTIDEESYESALEWILDIY